jgi:hypothetical protein
MGLGLWTRMATPPRPDGDAPVYRDPSAAGAAPRSLVPEDQPLPADAVVLRWTPVLGVDGADGAGVRYSVLVLGADLEPVLSLHGLEDTEVRIDPTLVAPLLARAGDLPVRLTWQVEAHRPEAGPLVSDSFFVTIVKAQS